MIQSQQTHRPPLRSVLEAYVNITAATYTAKAGDRVIGVNRAGAVTVTLPTAEVRRGRVYTVKDESGAASSNNITVATEGSETIDGSATDVINVNYESKSYYSDGTNWFILPVTPDTNTQNTYEAPGFTLGASNVEGTGNSIRSGATIALFDATDPSTQAHGDAAAVGAASVAARRDHKHAMPAAGSDISARVTDASAQTISDNTSTAVNFDQEDFDTDGMHDNVTNNTRLTAKTAGKYIIVGILSFLNTNAAGARGAKLRINGATVIAQQNQQPDSTNDDHDLQVSAIYNFAVNDYVELIASLDAAGASIDIVNGNHSLAMAKVLG